MKESIAKTKWCPMTRMVFGYENGTTQPFNRFACDPKDKGAKKITDAMNGGNGTKCIGSSCMMWESYEWESKDNQGGIIKNREGEGDCGLITKELQCNV